MINNLRAFGKFLDQPILISKLNKSMPKIMAAGGALYLIKEGYDVFQKEEDKDKAKNIMLKKTIVLSCAIMSALIAPKIASKITKRAPLENIKKVKEKNAKLIDDFIKNNNPDKDIIEILNKAKGKVMSFSNVKSLIERLKKSDSGKNFMDKLIPDPQNIKAKDIFSEIGYLSIYGAVPVVGGILGGISADIATKDSSYKEKIPDKINEGIYQYLANIFMCNIGAGAALGVLEKSKITSKPARIIGMTTGIILTGVIGGSKIANLISKKIISPIISPNKKPQERKPELMDIGLHTDDIATVSLLSGLKWIEPMLPILYSVSGYKAGSGYRN